MALNGVMALILRYIAKVRSFRGALRKMYVYDVGVKTTFCYVW